MQNWRRSRGWGYVCVIEDYCKGARFFAVLLEDPKFNRAIDPLLSNNSGRRLSTRHISTVPVDSDSRNLCIRSKHPVDIPTIGNDRRNLNARAVSRDMIAREEKVLSAVSESLPSYDDLMAKITKQDKGPSVGGKNARFVSEDD